MPRPLLFDELSDLIEQLRLDQFEVDVRQFIAAETLMHRLAAGQELPVDPDSLCDLLCPIFATSPATQIQFRQNFHRWRQRQNAGTVSVNTTLSAPVSSSPPAARKVPHLPSVRAVLVTASCAAVGVLALGGWFFWREFQPLAIRGRVTDTAGVPLAGAVVGGASHWVITEASGEFSLSVERRDLPLILGVSRPQYLERIVPVRDSGHAQGLTIALTPRERAPEPARPPERQLVASQAPDRSRTAAVVHFVGWLKWVLAAIPLLSALLYRGWTVLPRWYLRAWGLKRQPRLDSVRVAGSEDLLLPAPSFRRVSQALRRRRPSGPLFLDINRTIQLTIRKGGYFTPWLASRPSIPEYLVLLDHTGPNDQQMQLQQELVKRLGRNDVLAEVFYFSEDPRFVSREPAAGRLEPLQDLAARFPLHYLILCSGGSVLFDHLTGLRQPWVAEFEAWNEKALFCSDLEMLSGEEEESLADAGFAIVPASPAGLENLTAAVVLGYTGVRSAPAAGAYPRLLRDSPRRWRDRAAPPEPLQKRLVAQLRGFLGDRGVMWLAGCAAYPKLQWDLTIYLGYALAGAELTQVLLFDIVRLPWFRHGTMPEWLRVRLLAALPAEDRGKIRAVLEQLLNRIVEAGGQGFNLEIASDPEAASPLSAWKRGLLRNLIRSQPPGNPLRDYVLLSLLTQKQDQQLQVPVPSPLKRLLYRRGVPVFGWRTWPPVLAGALLGAGAWAAVNAVPVIPVPPLFVSLTLPPAPAVTVSPPVTPVTCESGSPSSGARFSTVEFQGGSLTWAPAGTAPLRKLVQDARLDRIRVTGIAASSNANDVDLALRRADSVAQYLIRSGLTVIKTDYRIAEGKCPGGRVEILSEATNWIADYFGKSSFLRDVAMQGSVLLATNFAADSPRVLNDFDGANDKLSNRNGELIYTRTIADGSFAAFDLPGISVTDFIMYVDVRFIAGDVNSVPSWAIFFRRDEWNRGYILAGHLQMDGETIQLNLFRRLNGGWLDTIPLNRQVKKGESAGIAIRCVGPRIQIYVDQERGLDISDPTASSGGIGLGAGAIATVGYSHLLINTLETGKTASPSPPAQQQKTPLPARRQ